MDTPIFWLFPPSNQTMKEAIMKLTVTKSYVEVTSVETVAKP